MDAERQERDFKWYIGEMPDLYRRHGHCYAVISNESVLATYGDYNEAIDAAISMSDGGALDTFIVQEVGADESAYTSSFTSAWVVA